MPKTEKPRSNNISMLCRAMDINIKRINEKIERIYLWESGNGAACRGQGTAVLHNEFIELFDTKLYPHVSLIKIKIKSKNYKGYY